jgi:tetratricopeptide (TPR) repeat protein
LFRESRLLLGAVLLVAHVMLVSCGTAQRGKAENAPPPPPTNVAVEAISEGVRVTWDEVPGATRFTVFWGDEKGIYRALADTEGCCVVITQLKKGDLYSFAVSSWSDKGESGFSSEQLIVHDDRKDREHVQALVTKGNDLLHREELPDAHAYLSAAIRLDPGNAEAYRSRAVVNEKLGRAEPARNDFAKADTLYNHKQISLRDLGNGAVR